MRLSSTAYINVTDSAKNLHSKKTRPFLKFDMDDFRCRDYRGHGRMNYKDTKPYMSAFLSVDLLTDFAAFCLTDFIDWRYIHSLVCIFNPACELLPKWKKELYFTCVLLPLYCTFSLTSFPLPPLPNVQYIQTVCDCGGGWC